MKITRDLPYARIEGAEPNLLSLDIYAPENAKNCPAMVWAHGGAWARGDKGQVANLPAAFLREGFDLVSVNYRLAPQVKFDAQAQDVAAAIAWVHRHAKEYGGDPSRVFAMGHSAGAHLVALVGTDENYLKAQGLSLAALRGVVPLDTEVYDLKAFAARFGGKLPDLYATPFTQDWGSSDHQPFAQSGYAAFMAIENSVGEIRGHSNSYYHTSSDWSGGPAGSAYDYLFATQVVQAVVAAVAGAAEILPAPIALRVDQDRDFTYQNTPLITQDRHQVRLNISVLDDPNGNANYAAQVVKASGPGDVTIRPTADPEVWEILGGRAGQGATGPVTLAVQVSGNQYGGEGATTCAITVRLIGDIDGDADVDGDDKAEMNRMLNSLSTPFGEQCFDLDGNGDVDGDDKAALNRMLNSLAVP